MKKTAIVGAKKFILFLESQTSRAMESVKHRSATIRLVNRNTFKNGWQHCKGPEIICTWTFFGFHIAALVLQPGLNNNNNNNKYLFYVFATGTFLLEKKNLNRNMISFIVLPMQNRMRLSCFDHVLLIRNICYLTVVTEYSNDNNIIYSQLYFQL